MQIIQFPARFHRNSSHLPEGETCNYQHLKSNKRANFPFAVMAACTESKSHIVGRSFGELNGEGL
jgi:hypothetical protein